MEKKPIVRYVDDLGENLEKFTQNHAKTFSPLGNTPHAPVERRLFSENLVRPAHCRHGAGKPDRGAVQYHHMTNFRLGNPAAFAWQTAECSSLSDWQAFQKLGDKCHRFGPLDDRRPYVGLRTGSGRKMTTAP
jgi:hypothetical protein